jgi:hypothetical protein
MRFLLDVLPAAIADIVEAARWYPKSEAESKSDPIAQGFAEFTLAPGESLVSRPHPLQTRNLAPIGTIFFKDLVLGHFHGDVEVMCEHKFLGYIQPFHPDFKPEWGSEETLKC